MQQLNLNYPDKEDFRLWFNEAKREILDEVLQVVSSKLKPSVEYKTRQEICEKYHISLVTLHERTKEGLPSFKIGKRRLYNPVEVEKYLNEHNLK